ncbi:MAG TPA: tyrosine-type recombinase/integrase [Candidatus Xenobia bacterium]|jgi:integrase
MARKDGKDRGLFERPKGSGTWWIEWHDQDGGRHREKVGPKSLAREAYQKRKTGVKSGVFFPETMKKRQRVTVRAAIDHYLDTHQANRSRPSDLGYAKRWADAFGGRALETLTHADIAPWLQQRASESSPATARHYLAFLRRVCRQAMQNQQLQHDPTMGVKAGVGPDKKRDRWLKKDEEERLRPEIPEARWSLVQIAYMTGLRQSEQFPLRRDQVDLEHRRIRLAAAKGARLAGEGGPEYVHLSTQASEILRLQLSSHRLPWVWPNYSGTNHLDAHNWVQDVFKPACERAGVADFRWHII